MACRATLACAGDALPDALPESQASCERACVDTSTRAQRACVLAAEVACEALTACFGPVAPPADPVVDDECTRACALTNACAGADLPPEAAQVCHAGCLADSSPAQRACVLAAGQDCAAATVCFGAGEPPDEALLDACAMACEVTNACAGAAPPPDADAACVAGCVETSTADQRDCVMLALGDCDAVTACFVLVAPPEPALQAACESGCDATLACAGPDEPPTPELRVSCISGCVTESTDEQRACVAAAVGCDAIEACFVPSSPPAAPDLLDACERACGAVLACAAPGAEPPIEHIADCVGGCVATSTDDQRDCALNNTEDCAALTACFAVPGEQP